MSLGIYEFLSMLKVSSVLESEDIAARTLALPFHTLIEPDDQAYVADALRAALGR